MIDSVKNLVKELEPELIRFAQDMVRIPSPTCREANVAVCVKERMIALGYDRVTTDKLGNVIGVIGEGSPKILFDAHMDTVGISNPGAWTHEPFGAAIVDGRLYGRGSADMKGALAAAVYAGHVIKRLGLHGDRAIMVTATVMEEDYDGECVYTMLTDGGIAPDVVVICEPTNLRLALGHKGRALLKVTTQGVSAHGSAPDKGVNAVYKMQPVIKRAQALNKTFPGGSDAPSLAVTKIESDAVCINAIPSACRLYLDRRLAVGENEETLAHEMRRLLDGSGASWEIYREHGTTYTGEAVDFHAMVPAWEIDPEHSLTRACADTYRRLTGDSPGMFKWDFCTNGVATAGRLGIPTIGFGPGDDKLAHTVDEFCPISHIVTATQFYALLVDNESL